MADFASYLGQGGFSFTPGMQTDIDAAKNPPPITPQGGVVGFLGDPQKMLALAQLGKAISPQAIYGGKVMNTPGRDIAEAVIPGLQGDVAQVKKQNVSTAVSDSLAAGTIPGKASPVLGSHTYDPSSEHITGGKHSVNADGSASFQFTSPGPKEYQDAQVIKNQIASGQPPTPTTNAPALQTPPTLQASQFLAGDQSPFVGSQGSAGAPGSDLIPALLRQESGGQDYRPDGTPVTSPKGAKYAMQVMPSTAANPGYGIAPAANDSPEEYNRVGRDVLSAMMQKYGGDRAKALAAYNAGPGAVDAAIASHGENYLQALPQETQQYVPAILGGRGGGQAPVRYTQANTGTMTDAQLPPPIVASEPQRYSGYLGPPVSGLSPEQVKDATEMGIRGAAAPYEMAHKAAQTALAETQAKALPISAAHQQAETEQIRLGLPTKKAQRITLPGGTTVDVTGEDILKYQIALNVNAVAQQHLQLQLEQAKSTSDMRESIAGMKKMQEEELRLKNLEKETKIRLIEAKDKQGIKVPGTDLSYGEAESMGALNELLKQDQQNRALAATTANQRAHDARALYTKIATDIQTPALAKQMGLTTQQYIHQQMSTMVGPDWKTVTGLQSQSSSNIPDPLGIRKK